MPHTSPLHTTADKHCPDPSSFCGIPLNKIPWFLVAQEGTNSQHSIQSPPQPTSPVLPFIYVLCSHQTKTGPELFCCFSLIGVSQDTFRCSSCSGVLGKGQGIVSNSHQGQQLLGLTLWDARFCYSCSTYHSRFRLNTNFFMKHSFVLPLCILLCHFLDNTYACIMSPFLYCKLLDQFDDSVLKQ